MAKSKLKAYYYSGVDDSFFIDYIKTITIVDEIHFDVVKIGLALSPSTRDFMEKVRKRQPHLHILALNWFYNIKTKQLDDGMPF